MSDVRDKEKAAKQAELYASGGCGCATTGCCRSAAAMAAAAAANGSSCGASALEGVQGLTYPAARLMPVAERRAKSFLQQVESDFKSGGQGGMWKGKKGGKGRR